MSRSRRPALLLLAALPALGLAARAMCAPVLLSDSTTFERWTLPSGLEVLTRNVPGAPAVALSWGYRFGLDDCPPDRSALAALLAEVAFTAPAGDVPERTREEMAGLRPEGWTLKVNRRQMLFSETARPEQFAGALHQVAARLAGVTVTEDCLRRARETVRRQRGEQFISRVDKMLLWEPGELARGTDKARIVSLAAAADLDRETVKSVRERLARVAVPANGVLAMVGDFGHLDVHAAVESELGRLRRSARPPQAPPVRLDSATVVLTRADVDKPLGAIGIIAPALSDTLQPAFYLAALILGAQANESWGLVEPPFTARFQYPLLDDPELVRFYPQPPREGIGEPAKLTSFVGGLLDAIRSQTIMREVRQRFCRGISWILGGPMTPTMVEDLRGDAPAVALLANMTASRALWGDEAFWAEYRRRFEDAAYQNPLTWSSWIMDPTHQVRLLFVPAR